jgi:hypothetical protein
MEIEKYVQKGEDWVAIAQKAYEAQQKRKYFEKQEEMYLTALKHKTGNEPCIGGGLVFYPEQRVGGAILWKLQAEASRLKEDLINAGKAGNALPSTYPPQSL